MSKGRTHSTLVLTKRKPIYMAAPGLGIFTNSINIEETVLPPIAVMLGLGSGKIINFMRGLKFFELTSHLDNVLATVTTIDYYYEEDIAFRLVRL
jgi:hypothetical protein